MGWGRIDDRRTLEIGSAGPMRDRLVGLILDGSKRAAAGLLVQDYEAEDEPVEHVGEELVVIDSAGAAVSVVVVDHVEVTTFNEVTWEFADTEGEGFTSIEHWREGHRRFWSTLDIAVTDATSVVCLWFHVASRSG